MASPSSNSHQNPKDNNPNAVPAFAPMAFLPSVSVKLDGGNFLIWRRQIEAVIKCHRLRRLLINTEIPRQFLTEADHDAGINVNEEYLRWEEQDQLLFSWLLSTLSDPILRLVVGCAHSWQLWDEINNFFNTQARARVRQFRSELHKIKKDTISVSEYLLRIRTQIDLLAYAGSPISTQEHIDVILEGLLGNYDDIVTSINTNTRLEDSYTVREFEAMLLAHEARIEIQGQNLIRDLIMKMQTYLLHEAHRQPDPQSTTHPLYINEV